MFPATRKIVTLGGFTIWLCAKHFDMWDDGQFPKNEEDHAVEIW